MSTRTFERLAGRCLQTTVGQDASIVFGWDLLAGLAPAVDFQRMTLLSDPTCSVLTYRWDPNLQAQRSWERTKCGGIYPKVEVERSIGQTFHPRPKAFGLIRLVEGKMSVHPRSRTYRKVCEKTIRNSIACAGLSEASPEDEWHLGWY